MGLRVWGSFVIACGAAALAGCLMAGCNRGAAGGSLMNERPPAPVTVAEAVARDVPLYIDEIGKAVATESVTVMPQVSGRVDSVHFEEGTDVKKGDLLFQIDARPFQAAVDQAKAAVAQDLANLDFAKSDFARVEALKGTSAVSQTEYDQKKSAVAVGQATVEAGQAAVKTAQLNLEYCEIRSPIDGRSGQRLVDAGNIVQADQTALTTVQTINPIYIDFTINERQLAEVRQYMSGGTLPVLVSLSNQLVATPTTQPASPYGGPTPTTAPIATAPPTTNPTTLPTGKPDVFADVRKGQLVFLDNTVQDATGTVKLRALLPNSDHHFWPGQLVDVQLVLTTLKDAVLVPYPAIQISQQGTFVYVVNDQQEAEIRLITEGQRQGDFSVVTGPVKPGDRVITTGQMLVAPGSKVMVQNTAETIAAR